MGLARIHNTLLLCALICYAAVPEKASPSPVYGKVIERIDWQEMSSWESEKKETWSDSEQGTHFLSAFKKAYSHLESATYIIKNAPGIPENDKRIASILNPIIQDFVITRVQVQKILDSTGTWTAPPKDSVLTLYSFTSSAPTYNIKEKRFYQFKPIASIDSNPRVFLPHHFSRPVSEEELSSFPYDSLKEYSRYQDYIQMDSIDAPPLYSTALRMVQEKKYDSIPEVLKIATKLKETYGQSPISGYEAPLALLANDTNYLKAYNFRCISCIFMSDSNALRADLQKALIAPANDFRFEKSISVLPVDIRTQLRDGRSYAMRTKTHPSSKQKRSYGPLFYLYFGGEAQLLRNGAQKVFKSDYQMGLNWMGIGGCFGGGPFCMDYEVTFFYSKKTGEDHVVNDTLYNRENGDARLSLLLEWRPYYTPYFDVRAYVGYHWNAYSFHIDSDYDVDKNHQYNNIGDFADFSFGGMLNFSPFDLDIDVSDEGWKIYAGFRLKVGYIFLNTPEFNNLNGGGFTTGFYMYVGI